jgi:hypothetical protein
MHGLIVSLKNKKDPHDREPFLKMLIGGATGTRTLDLFHAMEAL